MTTIKVSNNDPGMITFRINIANRKQLGRDMLIDVFIDTDRKTTTGSPGLGGADYVIELAVGDINLFRWDGTNFTRRSGDPSAATLSYSYRRGATIKISAADLGNTRAFRFLVEATSGIVVDPDTQDLDFASTHDSVAIRPGGGLYPYTVRMTPPKLVVRSLSTTPGKPAAGKLFTATLVAARADTRALLKGGQVTCVAKAGRVALAARAQGFRGSRAVCAWKIPEGARGKAFVGSIAVVFEGIRVARSVSGRIG
jgi:hypothetical protein